MHLPKPESGLRSSHRLALTWAGAAAVVVGGFVAVLGWRTAVALPAALAAAARGCSEPESLRVQRASGLSAGLLAALRAQLPADGRLVLYSPYGGKEYELDGADPRGEPARQVRTLFERTKNLLYPTPRDVRFARDPDELRAQLEGAAPGEVLVVDGTQGNIELSVGGAYELVHVEALGSGAQLRLWLLRRRV